MSYLAPVADLIQTQLVSGYSAPAAENNLVTLNAWAVDYSGAGYLSGSFPDGITMVEGAPTPATIRVHYRPAPGERGDGDLVAQVQSAADGSWRVEGLDLLKRFDVVCRYPGYNDLILANVRPSQIGA